MTGETVGCDDDDKEVMRKDRRKKENEEGPQGAAEVIHSILHGSADHGSQIQAKSKVQAEFETAAQEGAEEAGEQLEEVVFQAHLHMVASYLKTSAAMALGWARV